MEAEVKEREDVVYRIQLRLLEIQLRLLEEEERKLKLQEKYATAEDLTRMQRRLKCIPTKMSKLRLMMVCVCTCACVCVCVCAISRFLHSFVAIATMQGAAGPPQEEDYKCGGELRSTTSGTEGGPVADVMYSTISQQPMRSNSVEIFVALTVPYFSGSPSSLLPFSLPPFPTPMAPCLFSRRRRQW